LFDFVGTGELGIGETSWIVDLGSSDFVDERTFDKSQVIQVSWPSAVPRPETGKKSKLTRSYPAKVLRLSGMLVLLSFLIRQN